MTKENQMQKQKLDLLPDDYLEMAADCLKVMAHPVRLRIVNILMQGEFAVHEIAELCDLAPHQTCEHLRLLKGHGFLDSDRRGRTVYYKIASPQLPGLLECIKKNCNISK
ncbi:HTH-type transcriptional repressor CzrA [Anaerohalosphaera lusitana]|uniref:HTH-type transcriptional repressor CzrA n=1 Tax=Anaerohalosphaera lusitana TaxID=1936003 RepID=A0A1U9NIM8_9BACT|nr:metalloregulator ArsR/SmtB family transcription factor [Anaerohalosphaera lusitana]AQT67783.1 HTH-type transcriptional repressor CzrA [Anaerohalosphaera lusitana]